jgi:hypothetical protein
MKFAEKSINKPRAFRLLPVLLAFMVVDATANAAPCTLPGLKWMAADWHNSVNPNGAQGRWNIAPGGVLIGSAFESRLEGKGHAEIMTVRQDSGSIRWFCVISTGHSVGPGKSGAAPMVFVASNCDGASAVFDGQDDHAGEHLT